MSLGDAMETVSLGFEIAGVGVIVAGFCVGAVLLLGRR